MQYKMSILIEVSVKVTFYNSVIRNRVQSFHRTPYHYRMYYSEKCSVIAPRDRFKIEMESPLSLFLSLSVSFLPHSQGELMSFSLK